MNKALIAFVATLSSVLLIGLSFSAKFAGGNGAVASCPAVDVSSNAEVKRGELLLTTTSEFKKFILCDGTIVYLDQNTQVKLEAYPFNGQASQLQLLLGRIIVDGFAQVRTRNLITSLDHGRCEVIHYSWLDQTDVTALANPGCSVNGSVQPVLDESNRYETFEQKLVGTQIFNPEASSAKAFYDWTELEFKGLRQMRNDNLRG